MADVDMAGAQEAAAAAHQRGEFLTAASKTPPPAPSALEQERDRLVNALEQLGRSNAELRRELDAQRAEGVALDRDYKEALQDNLLVVAKYRARVAALEEEIRRVNAGAGGGGAPFGQGEPRDVGGVGVGVVAEGQAAGDERGLGQGAAAGGAAAAAAAVAGAAAGAATTAGGAAAAGGGGNENQNEGGGVWV